MVSKSYKFMSMINLILGIGFMCLIYLFEISKIDEQGNYIAFSKINVVNLIVYFTLFVLVGLLLLNVLSLFHRVNKAKMIFKLSAIVAIILPLAFTLVLKYDKALDFWINNIVDNIKIISYIILLIAVGLWVIGLILNFTTQDRANIYHILQGVGMLALLVLFIYAFNWCGWGDGLNIIKFYKLLLLVLAIYLPSSSLALLVCYKRR